MNNIAEGFERYRLGEVHQFLSIAKGSAAEVRSMLYAGLDLGHLDDRAFQLLMRAAMDVTRLVAAWRSAIQREMHAGKELREDRFSWDEAWLAAGGDSEQDREPVMPSRGLRTQD
jgi:hypothetical protein